jgi:hypothetical protein
MRAPGYLRGGGHQPHKQILMTNWPQKVQKAQKRRNTRILLSFAPFAPFCGHPRFTLDIKRA